MAIKNSIQLPQLILSVYKKISTQKKYLQQNILPLLNAAKQSNDGSLDENDFKKITHYYGLAVPAILGEAFCVLHDTPITSKQLNTSTFQGAMTGLFDDFFEKQNLSEQALKNFIENPISITGSTSAEKLFLYFYNEALGNCPSKRTILTQLYKVYDAQVESKQQATVGLSQQQIKNITIKKGGESLLFYRTAFEFELTNAEQIMLYKLGGVMQLANDIFDVYKDYRGGIYTLMTTSQKVNDVRKLFIELLKEAQVTAYETNLPPKNAYRFLQIISLCIFSRVFVCLNHLEKAEQTSNGSFTLELYTRKQLICDMDKVGAVLQSIKYHIQFCKSY